MHPNDERYAQFIGKMLKVPFVDREIPVIVDAILVDKDFGTGSVKVTPSGCYGNEGGVDVCIST